MHCDSCGRIELAQIPYDRSRRGSGDRDGGVAPHSLRDRDLFSGDNPYGVGLSQVVIAGEINPARTSPKEGKSLGGTFEVRNIVVPRFRH